MSHEADLELAMQLIMYGGEAKSCAMEAIRAAKQGDGSQAQERLAAGRTALLEAHRTQTRLLADEAEGQRHDLSLFLVHGQDHLMTSITFLDLAQEIVDLYQALAQSRID